MTVVWRWVDTAGGGYWTWLRIWLECDGTIPEEYQAQGWSLTRTVTAGDCT
jgi:hypothetical protein